MRISGNQTCGKVHVEPLGTSRDHARYKSIEMDAQRIFRKDVPFFVGSPGTSNLMSDKKVCGLDVTGGFTAKTARLGNC